MKRRLDESDIAAAVWGGAILGGGGGGIPASGERTASLALELGDPELWTPDEFHDEDIAATVALVGAPAAPHPHVTPRYLLRALELLQSALPRGSRPLSAINSNENGAETTVNGWVQSALTGLPIVDLACNGRAHPTSLMGALGLHAETDYLSRQAFVGGTSERFVEGVASGCIDKASGIVRRASVEAGGLVTVARNPVRISYAARHGAPGAISYAMELGRVWQRGGVVAAVEWLRGSIMVEGKVSDYRCEQREGLDVGIVQLDDVGKTTLHFINEYMLAEQGGARICTFPDLIMTFTSEGEPVVSAQVREGMRIIAIRAPASRLLLSRTMHMPELYQPLEAMLGTKFAPLAA